MTAAAIVPRLPVRLWRSRWCLLRLALALFVLWVLLADAGARLARLTYAALPGFDYAAEVRHLRAQGRFGEALMVADAGLQHADDPRDQPDPDALARLRRERERTLDEQRSWLRRAGEVGLGALVGTGDSLEALLGAIAADFFIVGDVRDLLIQGARLALDGDTDEVILALSSIGLVTTLAPQFDWAPAILKAARKSGTLAAALGDQIVRLARAGRHDALARILADTRTLAARASPGGAARLLRHADSADDLAALARFVEKHPDGAFALHVTGADGARLITRAAARSPAPALAARTLPDAPAHAVLLAARKGSAGVAWLRAGAWQRMLRPHPILGVLKAIWKGNAPDALAELLRRADRHAWWLTAAAAAWAALESLTLARRLRARGSPHTGRPCVAPAAPPALSPPPACHVRARRATAPGTPPDDSRRLPRRQAHFFVGDSASIALLAASAVISSALVMVTGSSGTSWCPPLLPVFTPRILSTTPIPAATRPNTAYPAPSRGWSRNALSFTLMKNWHVAESAWFPSRAIAIVPRRFFSPLRHSFLIGLSAGFCFMSAVNPPPWIMKSGITR